MPRLFTTCALTALCLSACGGSGSVAAPTAAATPAAPATPATPTAPAVASTAGGKPANWNLAWADEFSTDGLPDPTRWIDDTERNQAGWYNHELQYYSRARLENTRISGGKLIITARKEKLTGVADYGGQAYTSGRLITRGKFEWTYGFLEVRAKLPCALGSWPAIWMLGTKGSWPDNGEIDIMEHVGKNKGVVSGSIHTGAYNWPSGTQKTASITVPDVCDAFHNYQLTWDAEHVAIGIDDKNYFSFANPKDGDLRKWPFSQPQYLLLNLAIGGDLGGTVDDAAFPMQMEVDYVRLYQP